LNYFELFGINETFDINTSSLAETYQSLQKMAHPDKFAHASHQDQLLAVQQSALINDAYQTLKQPLKRAEYILNQRDVDMPSEQHSFRDNMFLMRQMELREMLEEVKFASDHDAAISSANQELDTEYDVLLMNMQQQIFENTPASNEAASENLRKLKFYQKLHIELDRLEDQLFED
jgi:molecular chaperone HscB